MLHNVIKFIYGLLGVVFLFTGTGFALYNTGIVPMPLQEKMLSIAESNFNSLHLLQEAGSLLLFAGVMSFWAIRNYENSMGFHWAITAFWAGMALTHWLDVRGMRSIAGPMINSLPLVVFLVSGYLRVKGNEQSLQGSLA